MASKTIQNLHEIDAYALSRVKNKAKSLAGRWGTSKSDRPDIEQALLIGLWQALPNFDPAVGEWKPFVIAVLERTADKFKKSCLCQKRGEGRAVQSLNEETVDCDGDIVDFGDTLTAEVMFHRLRIPIRHETDRIELTEELEMVLAGLTERQQRLCRQLMEMNPSTLARRRGEPRSTLVDGIKKFRRSLRFSGFRIKLKK